MTPPTEPRMWDFSSGELPCRTQLLKSALRLTRSFEDAEDLIQETYLKAFKYYEGFTEGTNYLAAPPTKLRDARIDVSEFFDADGGRQLLPCRSS